MMVLLVDIIHMDPERWYHIATSGSNYTIDESETNPGDEIVCTASASDNDGASISSSASVIVENTDPSITSFSHRTRHIG